MQPQEQEQEQEQDQEQEQEQEQIFKEVVLHLAPTLGRWRPPRRGRGGAPDYF